MSILWLCVCSYTRDCGNETLKPINGNTYTAKYLENKIIFLTVNIHSKFFFFKKYLAMFISNSCILELWSYYKYPFF